MVDNTELMKINGNLLRLSGQCQGSRVFIPGPANRICSFLSVTYVYGTRRLLWFCRVNLSWEIVPLFFVSSPIQLVCFRAIIWSWLNYVFLFMAFKCGMTLWLTTCLFAKIKTLNIIIFCCGWLLYLGCLWKSVINLLSSNYPDRITLHPLNGWQIS